MSLIRLPVGARRLTCTLLTVLALLATRATRNYSCTFLSESTCSTNSSHHRLPSRSRTHSTDCHTAPFFLSYIGFWLLVLIFFLFLAQCGIFRCDFSQFLSAFERTVNIPYRVVSPTVTPTGCGVPARVGAIARSIARSVGLTSIVDREDGLCRSASRR